ncbi:hypothetical protein RRG08_022401 [Elysia crispata]|uniref:Uncharacterized protein n=1 Tax=Elysia crispata TaxID=231223 RepID=A0AAE1D852_9GAST|nr:hypothetical protein RRG08_022401 [Elysia crispata]
MSQVDDALFTGPDLELPEECVKKKLPQRQSIKQMILALDRLYVMLTCLNWMWRNTVRGVMDTTQNFVTPGQDGDFLKPSLGGCLSTLDSRFCYSARDLTRLTGDFRWLFPVFSAFARVLSLGRPWPDIPVDRHVNQAFTFHFQL